MECTPVQEETLKAVFNLKRDVYAQSQTGTGKTAAFLTPTLHMLMEPSLAPEKFALVLTPTRELAVQVQKEAELLGKYTGIKTACLYGGVGYDKQEAELRGKPRLVVGTPGRLMDFAKRQVLKLQNVCIWIVDEADRLFDMGFYQDIKHIAGKMPPPAERSSFLYSATLGPKVGNLAWEYMNNPVDIVIERNDLEIKAITQEVYHACRAEKAMLMLAILRHEKPSNAIIFSNTKAGAGQIAARLTQAGYRCAAIEGDVPQRKRLRIINEMKAGKLRYLAATDVAARGIHVPGLDLVINYDLPDDPENYVHRIGRTARAGATGKAISFACERFVYNLAPIEKLLGHKIPVCQVTNELQQEIEKLKVERRAQERAKRDASPTHPAAHEREASKARQTGGKRRRGPDNTANRAPLKKEGQPHQNRQTGGKNKPSEKRAAAQPNKASAAKRYKDKPGQERNRPAHPRSEERAPALESKKRETVSSAQPAKKKSRQSAKKPAQKRQQQGLLSFFSKFFNKE